MYIVLSDKVQPLKKRLVLFFVLSLIILLTLISGTAEAEKTAFESDYSSSRLVPIYKVQRDDNKIALTIDGAWGSQETEALLNLFAEEKIPVSFFFAGIWLNGNPDLVNKIITSGHDIYNHSYTHAHFNKLSRDKIVEELNRTEELINSFYSEERETRLFRPPYGEYNKLVISTAREMGYQVVQWSLDSHDWMDPGEEYILERIRTKIDSGDILLFHNNSNNIVQILSKVISELKEDYQFVRIKDLIYNNNYQISSLTGLQYKIKKEENNEN